MEKGEYKKISELAEIFDVSRQTIYNLVGEIEKEGLEGYIVVINGVKHITILGVDYIAKRLNKDNTVKNYYGNKENKKAHSDDSYIDRYISMLEEQIKQKDEQIKALNEHLRETQNLISQANTLNAINIKRLEGAEKNNDTSNGVTKCDTIDTPYKENEQDTEHKGFIAKFKAFFNIKN